MEILHEVFSLNFLIINIFMALLVSFAANLITDKFRELQSNSLLKPLIDKFFTIIGWCGAILWFGSIIVAIVFEKLFDISPRDIDTWFGVCFVTGFFLIGVGGFYFTIDKWRRNEVTAVDVIKSSIVLILISLVFLNEFFK